eukprot:TRINITY_DN97_c0_g3_i1.p1 TRINITY_DN97_c0_g3~~TRINITY_DN97_c0_g3_i1.p1  ORF type:complete len:1630 (+),score=512.31 TRINITY_DN97_c0_g3_i1:27-4892(+)
MPRERGSALGSVGGRSSSPPGSDAETDAEFLNLGDVFSPSEMENALGRQGVSDGGDTCEAVQQLRDRLAALSNSQEELGDGAAEGNRSRWFTGGGLASRRALSVDAVGPRGSGGALLEHHNSGCSHTSGGTHFSIEDGSSPRTRRSGASSKWNSTWRTGGRSQVRSRSALNCTPSSAAEESSQSVARQLQRLRVHRDKLDKVIEDCRQLLALCLREPENASAAGIVGQGTLFDTLERHGDSPEVATAMLSIMNHAAQQPDGDSLWREVCADHFVQRHIVRWLRAGSELATPTTAPARPVRSSPTLAAAAAVQLSRLAALGVSDEAAKLLLDALIGFLGAPQRNAEAAGCCRAIETLLGKEAAVRELERDRAGALASSLAGEPGCYTDTDAWCARAALLVQLYAQGEQKLGLTCIDALRNMLDSAADWWVQRVADADDLGERVLSGTTGPADEQAFPSGSMPSGLVRVPTMPSGNTGTGMIELAAVHMLGSSGAAAARGLPATDSGDSGGRAAAGPRALRPALTSALMARRLASPPASPQRADAGERRLRGLLGILEVAFALTAASEEACEALLAGGVAKPLARLLSAAAATPSVISEKCCAIWDKLLAECGDDAMREAASHRLVASVLAAMLRRQNQRPGVQVAGVTCLSRVAESGWVAAVRGDALGAAAALCNALTHVSRASPEAAEVAEGHCCRAILMCNAGWGEMHAALLSLRPPGGLYAVAQLARETQRASTRELSAEVLRSVLHAAETVSDALATAAAYCCAELLRTQPPAHGLVYLEILADLCQRSAGGAAAPAAEAAVAELHAHGGEQTVLSLLRRAAAAALPAEDAAGDDQARRRSTLTPRTPRQRQSLTGQHGLGVVQLALVLVGALAELPTAREKLLSLGALEAVFKALGPQLHSKGWFQSLGCHGGYALAALSLDSGACAEIARDGGTAAVRRAAAEACKWVSRRQRRLCAERLPELQALEPARADELAELRAEVKQLRAALERPERQPEQPEPGSGAEWAAVGAALRAAVVECPGLALADGFTRVLHMVVGKLRRSSLVAHAAAAAGSVRAAAAGAAVLCCAAGELPAPGPPAPPAAAAAGAAGAAAAQGLGAARETQQLLSGLFAGAELGAARLAAAEESARGALLLAAARSEAAVSELSAEAAQRGAVAAAEREGRQLAAAAQAAGAAVESLRRELRARDAELAALRQQLAPALAAREQGGAELGVLRRELEQRGAELAAQRSQHDAELAALRQELGQELGQRDAELAALRNDAERLREQPPPPPSHQQKGPPPLPPPPPPPPPPPGLPPGRQAELRRWEAALAVRERQLAALGESLRRRERRSVRAKHKEPHRRAQPSQPADSPAEAAPAGAPSRCPAVAGELYVLTGVSPADAEDAAAAAGGRSVRALCFAALEEPRSRRRIARDLARMGARLRDLDAQRFCGGPRAQAALRLEEEAATGDAALLLRALRDCPLGQQSEGDMPALLIALAAWWQGVRVLWAAAYAQQLSRRLAALQAALCEAEGRAEADARKHAAVSRVVDPAVVSFFGQGSPPGTPGPHRHPQRLSGELQSPRSSAAATERTLPVRTPISRCGSSGSRRRRRAPAVPPPAAPPPPPPGNPDFCL